MFQWPIEWYWRICWYCDTHYLRYSSRKFDIPKNWLNVYHFVLFFLVVYNFADYMASNSSLDLSIPTFSGTTTVQSLAGWIVFLQRIDGSLDFDQTWSVYKAGFGTYTGNYWMGLEKIHQITNAGRYKLRLEVFAVGIGWTSDEYYSFYLDNEAGGYALHVAGYSGENGDVLRWTKNPDWCQNGMKFSTKDVDNDLYAGACNPNSSTGGWWFNDCWMVNLNGIYGTSSFLYYRGGSWSGILIGRMMMKSV